MRTRYAWGSATAGFALTVVGMAGPASATLLDTLHTTTTTTLHEVVNAVPSSVNSSLSVEGPGHHPEKAHREHKAHQEHKAHKAHHGNRRHSATSAAQPATVASTRAPQRNPPRASTSHSSWALRTGPGVAPKPPRTPSVNPSPPVKPTHIGDVVQHVATALQTVAKLFGWNLLMLIPMAGIVFAISRRMAPTRHFASELLPPLDLHRK